jgi:hypothetical protein
VNLKLAFGAAIVATVLYAYAEMRPATRSASQETIDELATQKTADEVGVDSSIGADGDSAGIDKASPPNIPSDGIRTENQNDAVQLWSAYDISFEDSDPNSPLSQIHIQFKNQQRDESWAAAVEAGIRGSINPVAATRIGATVEHVECRSTICEVAGFMPDIMGRSQPDPRDIFVDNFGVGWWQGDFSMAVRQHSYQDEGIRRFLVIIANAGVIEEWSMPDQPRSSEE